MRKTLRLCKYIFLPNDLIYWLICLFSDLIVVREKDNSCLFHSTYTWVNTECRAALWRAAMAGTPGSQILFSSFLVPSKFQSSVYSNQSNALLSLLFSWRRRRGLESLVKSASLYRLYLLRSGREEEKMVGCTAHWFIIYFLLLLFSWSPFGVTVAG